MTLLNEGTAMQAVRRAVWQHSRPTRKAFYYRATKIR